MSVKNNALVAAVALSLGVVVAADASPIAEGMLNDLTLTSFGISETDAKGRVMVIVGTKDAQGVETFRPVADSKGDVRIFGKVDTAVGVAKRAKLDRLASVKYVKLQSTGSVSDPIKSLISKHKQISREALGAATQAGVLLGKITAAVAQGWDVAVGTPEAFEYADLLARQATVAEWRAFAEGRTAALAQNLRDAGIDPVTYLQLPQAPL